MSETIPLPASHFLNRKRIAIIGAGPSGLTLARLLQMRRVPVQVFELDASPTARNQGGSLDLHEDSGQLALRKAGLESLFHGAARPEGQDSRVFDKHGRLCAELHAEDEFQTRPEIDRGSLRDLLLNSLEPETVVWGQQLLRAEPDTAGKHRVVFENGAEITADLVIGCDGTWSKVRPLVSSTNPSYSGVTFIETRLTNPRQHHPDVAKLVGPGNIMALGENKGLMAQ